MGTQVLPSLRELIDAIVCLARDCRCHLANAASAVQVQDEYLAEMYTIQAETEKKQARLLLKELSQNLEADGHTSETWADCFNALNSTAQQEGFVQIGAMYKLLLA